MARGAGVPRDALRPGSERAGEGYRIDGVAPQIAQRPRTREELAALLATAAEADLVVVPQGGRTALTLGRPLERYDVALDLGGLDRIVAYEPEDLTVTVEAGVRLGELAERLAAHGQYLPVDPPPDDRVSIGGLLATGRSGAWRGQLPAARDLVLGMTVALPGQLVRSGGRVVKNVSGYDLHRLQTGALGAFGVIVEASFKLAALPPGTRSFALRTSGLEAAAELAFTLRDAALPLRALALLAPEAAAAVGLAREPYVLVEATGNEAALDRCATAVGHAATVLASGGQPPPLGMWARLRRLGGEDGDGREVVLRLGVPATALTETIEAARARGATAWGHLAAGSVLARGSTLGPADVLALREHAAERGGFLQIEAGPPSLRAEVDPFGEGERSLVRALRREFDPQRTINRGRWEPES